MEGARGAYSGGGGSTAGSVWLGGYGLRVGLSC